MTLEPPDSWRPKGIDVLEDRAWEALREVERSVCVSAGAGAGKTEFLAQKAAYLLQTGICAHPKCILAISFKKDAARNLASRVKMRCSRLQARRFHSLTFDAFTKNLLDRFRSAITEPHTPSRDYQIVFPKKRDIDLFLSRHGRHDVNADRFESMLDATPLPIADADIGVRDRRLLQAYWGEQYREDETMLSFGMVNRLVVYLLECNEQIRKALQLTYPFVFLDEFQDTTYSQYELMNAAFEDQPPIITAVGDDKQKIMGWAGAMDDAFQELTAEYHARRISLLSNWRSHADLVQIQQVIASEINPNVEAVVARGQKAIRGSTAAIWVFDSRDEEVRTIASWICAEVEQGNVNPDDVVILVRMKAKDVEEELSPALAREGFVLRNLARSVGDIQIQDLLSEELYELVFPLLRLGASNRDPAAWTSAFDRLCHIYAIDDERQMGLQRLRQSLEEFSRSLRAYMNEHDPDEETALEVGEQALRFADANKMRASFPQYRRDIDFERVWNGFKILLVECSLDGGSWSQVLDRFEGIGQVPLMTIHKSKGLEFHTMIFFGLDSRSWRGLTPNHGEELNALFVAITRAEQRTFFAYCRTRGGAIQWLEDLLIPEGVERITGYDLLAG